MKIKFLFLAGLVAGLLSVACEEVPVDGDVDVEGAQIQADAAISALEDELYTVINADSIDGLSGIDFTTSNALFLEALALDPANLDANFGAGLTGMMLFTQDPEVQAVFDAWEAFADTGSGFVAEQELNASSFLGMIIPGAASKSMVSPNETDLARTYLNLQKMMVSDPPTVADIQAVVESIFIPALDAAIDYFKTVTDSAEYTFAISPKMQGDLNEQGRELDLTEIHLLMAGVNVMRSISRVAVAYNVGPAAYDSAAIVPFLTQGQGFLTLKSNGAANMATAKTALLDASYNIDNAVAFLRSETDDQTDDLVRIMDGELTAADLDSVTKYTGEFRDKFQNGLTLTEDWDDDILTPDEELTFQFSVFFDNPISDFKSLLPAYTVSVGRDSAYYHDWFDTNFTVIVPVDIPVDVPGDYYYQYDAWWDDWDGLNTSENHNLPITIPSLNSMIDSLTNEKMSDETLGNWSIHVSWNGNLLASMTDIEVFIWTNWETKTPDYSFYTGILTFTANSAAEWIFPNPTINGFIPDMTDEKFKRFIHFTDEDFEKELIIPFEMGRGRDDGMGKAFNGPTTALLPW